MTKKQVRKKVVSKKKPVARKQPAAKPVKKVEIKKTFSTKFVEFFKNFFK